MWEVGVIKIKRTLSMFFCQSCVVFHQNQTKSQTMVALKEVVLVALIVSCVVFSVAGQEQSSNDSSLVETARTFGHHFLKRISFAIIPGAFVIGAVTTLLAALTIVSMNGLGVGVSCKTFFI